MARSPLAFVLLSPLLVAACIGPIEEAVSTDEVGDDDPGEGDSSDSSEGSTSDDSTTDDSSEGSTTDGETTDGETDETGETGCDLGALDCPCKRGACEEGLACVDGVCVSSPKNACGWDQASGYYECGFEGEDPEGNFPLDCGNLPLVNGAPCPTGFTVQGCCDADGNLWWCNVDDKVEYEPC